MPWEATAPGAVSLRVRKEIERFYDHRWFAIVCAVGIRKKRDGSIVRHFTHPVQFRAKRDKLFVWPGSFSDLCLWQVTASEGRKGEDFFDRRAGLE
ncbi:MAG TPA: hypothetical protein VGB07_09175, partial [Blastocatellia bacterium]